MTEYLQQEETATERHEYFNGESLMLAGGTHNHEVINVNMIAALHQHARRKGCTAYGSNMKILVKANGLFTYPDAMLICGKIEFVLERKDIVTNPGLIVKCSPIPRNPMIEAISLHSTAAFLRLPIIC